MKINFRLHQHIAQHLALEKTLDTPQMTIFNGRQAPMNKQPALIFATNQTQATTEVAPTNYIDLNQQQQPQHHIPSTTQPSLQQFQHQTQVTLAQQPPNMQLPQQLTQPLMQ